MNIPIEIKRAAWTMQHAEKDIAIETQETSLCGFDADTRHKLNLSTQTPSLDLARIEATGVSLEELATCETPVCYYKTQVTIHGAFPDFTARYCKATSYQSLIQNQNGSIGIRWIAVDGEKKKTLRQACLFGKGLWRGNSNSTETWFSIVKPLSALPELQAIAKTIPRNLFFGNVSLCRAPLYGLAFLEIDVAAIPQAGFWALAGFLAGIASREEYQALQADEEAKHKAEEEERQHKREVEKAQAENQHKAFVAAMSTNGLREVTPQAGKHYVRVVKSAWNDKQSVLHVQTFKAFGKLVARREVCMSLEDAKQACWEKRGLTGKGKELRGTCFEV